MKNGNNEARRALLAGKPPQEAMRAAKAVAAFSGEPMRGNLIRQLKSLGYSALAGDRRCGSAVRGLQRARADNVVAALSRFQKR